MYLAQLMGGGVLLTASSSNVFLSLQIGSYFGGELCGVDLNQDGETELLLIGVPLFYGEQRGGRVFVYQRKQVGTRSLSGRCGRNRLLGLLRAFPRLILCQSDL